MLRKTKQSRYVVASRRVPEGQSKLTASQQTNRSQSLTRHQQIVFVMMASLLSLVIGLVIGLEHDELANKLLKTTRIYVLPLIILCSNYDIFELPARLREIKGRIEYLKDGIEKRLEVIECFEEAIGSDACRGRTDCGGDGMVDATAIAEADSTAFRPW